MKPVRDNITLAGLGVSILPSHVSNTDLVVVMTASPEPADSVFEAFAVCLQRDQVPFNLDMYFKRERTRMGKVELTYASPVTRRCSLSWTVSVSCEAIPNNWKPWVRFYCILFQTGRCTVGTFNWVPKYIKTDAASLLSNSIAASERRTAVHELTHLLGFESPLTGACRVFHEALRRCLCLVCLFVLLLHSTR